MTRADLRKIRSLTITKNDNVSNLNDLYNFPSLGVLTLEGVTFENLSGIEYAVNLETIYIKSSSIKNYSALSNVENLSILLFLGATTDEINNLCDNTVGIGGKDLNKLTSLGIFGKERLVVTETSIILSGDCDGNVHSNFSDLSCLSKLSTKTKNNILNLYLNNNSISDISNLYEFENLKLLFIESNYIRNLNGVFNLNKNVGMTKLESLYARSNELGKEIESEELNPNVDALSSFSKAEEKSEGKYNFTRNLTKINFLDLGLNPNLKNIDYLIPLSSLKTLYLDGCAGLNLDSVLKSSSLIGGCDSKIDSEFSFYIACNDNSITKLDLTIEGDSGNVEGRKLTETAFKELLNDKVNLTWLKLDKLKLTDKNDSPLSEEELDSCLNDVLENLTKLEELSLNGIKDLKNLDFIEKTSNLIELDLRGTGATDLSILDTDMLKAQCVWIDNENIDISKLQNLINRCNKRVSANYLVSQYDVGLILGNQSLANQLVNCTSIASFFTTRQSGVNLTYDLRNCSKLKGDGVFLGAESYYLPVHLNSLGYFDEKGNMYNGVLSSSKILNKTELVNLKRLCVTGQSSSNVWDDFLGYPSLETLYVNEESSGTRFSGDMKVGLCQTSLKNLSIIANSYSGGFVSLTDENLVGLGDYTELLKLELVYQSKITTLPEEASKLEKLITLNASGSGLLNLHVCENFNSLETLDISNCRNLLETGFYKNDSQTLVCDNMQILADLNGRSLKNIYLQGTGISNFSKIEKLEWNKKSGF